MAKIRILRSVSEFDGTFFMAALVAIPVTDIRELRQTPFDIRKVKRITKGVAAERAEQWLRSDFLKTADWSRKERIPCRFRYGVLPPVSNLIFAGIEVKLGTNGGSYYRLNYCRVDTDKYIELE